MFSPPSRSHSPDDSGSALFSTSAHRKRTFEPIKRGIMACSRCVSIQERLLSCLRDCPHPFSPRGYLCSARAKTAVYSKVTVRYASAARLRTRPVCLRRLPRSSTRTMKSAVFLFSPAVPESALELTPVYRRYSRLEQAVIYLQSDVAAMREILYSTTSLRPLPPSTHHAGQHAGSSLEQGQFDGLPGPASPAQYRRVSPGPTGDRGRALKRVKLGEESDHDESDADNGNLIPNSAMNAPFQALSQAAELAALSQAAELSAREVNGSATPSTVKRRKRHHFRQAPPAKEYTFVDVVTKGLVDETFSRTLYAYYMTQLNRFCG